MKVGRAIYKTESSLTLTRILYRFVRHTAQEKGMASAIPFACTIKWITLYNHNQPPLSFRARHP